MSGWAVIEDALRGCLALAQRLEKDFARAAESARSRGGARDLSRAARAIAENMRREAESHLKTLSATGVVDLASVLALNQRAQTAEDLHALVENSTHRTLHPVLSPTVRAELEALGVPGPVLVAGTRDV